MAKSERGCGKLLLLALAALVAIVLGGLLWDVMQLRGLQPPEDSTFEGFVRSGKPGTLRLDAAGGRLYWIAPFPRTIIRSPAPPAYEFNRAGVLVNWTPGAEKGMLQEAPVRPRGEPATPDQARRWFTPK